MPPSRSIADATRFTPTIPHAFTRSPMPPSATSSSASETPQQRVARLREAARMSKLAQASTFDRIIDRGRVWADKAHRVVALSLIGATVICGGITIFASVDMIMFARRKKQAFQAEQRALREAEARAAASEPAAQEAGVPLPTNVTMTDKIKTWALSGLTPAEKEEELRQQQTNTDPLQVFVKEDISASPGADGSAKSERANAGSAGILSSITRWWSGRSS